MTIVHKDGNIHKNVDGLTRWPLPNEIENPAYVPEEASPPIPIEGISVTYVNTTFFEELKNSYTQDMNSYKTFINSSTNQTPDILEEGRNPRLPQNFFRKYFVEIHPTASRFKGVLEKARNNAGRRMEYSFAFAKDKGDKSHATSYFKVGDLVLLSITNLNNIKGCKRLEESFSGTFDIKAFC
ncbi:hypothetical protein O181_043050 [Austropuccinia psidii MF-1]|uniref:Uncharacterized protein n=1 Tax=Austropuccinia psidii MF-1 TaxID=1389203 RepID=A0A9Q3HIS5_9BASI|nr:hypothetical protein [Austropuccinia psidii MF-1]